MRKDFIREKEKRGGDKRDSPLEGLEGKGGIEHDSKALLYLHSRGGITTMGKERRKKKKI